MIIFFYSGLVIIFNTPSPLNLPVTFTSPLMQVILDWFKNQLSRISTSLQEGSMNWKLDMHPMGCRGVEWGVVSLLPPLSLLLAGAYNKTELVWIVEIWALVPGNNLHLLTQLRSFHVITTTIKSSTYQTSPPHAISPLHKKYLERLWEVN